MKILVVDDDATTLSLAERVLREDGHAIVTAESGREALDHIEEMIDIVISDYFMPGMNGEELFEAIRERYPAMPFVYLTAADDLSVAVGLVRKGASDLIQKPIRPEELRMRVDRIIHEISRRRAVEAIRHEQELLRRENQRLVTWRMLYASKDARQTRQLVDNLSRNINASGGFDWVDLLDEMKQPHDDDNYLIARAVVDLADHLRPEPPAAAAAHHRDRLSPFRGGVDGLDQCRSVCGVV
jgi:DNA-binding NtrC family response regulator